MFIVFVAVYSCLQVLYVYLLYGWFAWSTFVQSLREPSVYFFNLFGMVPSRDFGWFDVASMFLDVDVLCTPMANWTRQTQKKKR